MNKFFGILALTTALAVPSVASAQVAKWKAIAGLEEELQIDYWGGIGEGSTEEEARSAAMTLCEEITGRTCKKAITTSVPKSWYIVVSHCYGRATTGGSRTKTSIANVMAGKKIGISDGQGCKVVRIFPPGCASKLCEVPPEN